VTVDDEVMFLSRFESGALGRIEASRFAQGRKNFLGFEINGERGSITFDYENMTKLGLYLSDGPESQRGFRTINTGPAHPYGQHLWPIPALGIGFTETKIIEVADFFAAIVENRKVSPDFHDAYRISQIVDAVEESARTNAWVAVG
jgi:predicted dehydrogenase